MKSEHLVILFRQIFNEFLINSEHLVLYVDKFLINSEHLVLYVDKFLMIFLMNSEHLVF
jgi:hypothetical protein